MGRYARNLRHWARAGARPPWSALGRVSPLVGFAASDRRHPAATLVTPIVVNTLASAFYDRFSTVPASEYFENPIWATYLDSECRLCSNSSGGGAPCVVVTMRLPLPANRSPCTLLTPRVLVSVTFFFHY